MRIGTGKNGSVCFIKETDLEFCNYVPFSLVVKKIEYPLWDRLQQQQLALFNTHPNNKKALGQGLGGQGQGDQVISYFRWVQDSQDKKWYVLALSQNMIEMVVAALVNDIYEKGESPHFVRTIHSWLEASFFGNVMELCGTSLSRDRFLSTHPSTSNKCIIQKRGHPPQTSHQRDLQNIQPFFNQTGNGNENGNQNGNGNQTNVSFLPFHPPLKTKTKTKTGPEPSSSSSDGFYSSLSSSFSSSGPFSEEEKQYGLETYIPPSSVFNNQLPTNNPLNVSPTPPQQQQKQNQPFQTLPPPSSPFQKQVDKKNPPSVHTKPIHTKHKPTEKENENQNQKEKCVPFAASLAQMEQLMPFVHMDWPTMHKVGIEEILVVVLFTLSLLQQKFRLVHRDLKPDNLLIKILDGKQDTSLFRQSVALHKVDYFAYHLVFFDDDPKQNQPSNRNRNQNGNGNGNDNRNINQTKRRITFYLPNRGFIIKMADFGMSTLHGLPLPPSFSLQSSSSPYPLHGNNNNNNNNNTYSMMSETFFYDPENIVAKDYAIEKEFSKGYDMHFFLPQLIALVQSWSTHFNQVKGNNNNKQNGNGNNKEIPIILQEIQTSYSFPINQVSRPVRGQIMDKWPWELLTELRWNTKLFQQPPHTQTILEMTLDVTLPMALLNDS